MIFTTRGESHGDLLKIAFPHLRSHDSSHQESQAEVVSLVKPEEHVSVLYLEIGRDALPFCERSKFFYGQLHDGAGCLWAEELNQPRGGFYKSADPLKRFYAAGKYFERRGESQV